jgi:hypothetical protein
MSGSINKILNDALDQTILNETELTEVFQGKASKASVDERIAAQAAAEEAKNAPSTIGANFQRPASPENVATRERAQRTSAGTETWGDKLKNASENPWVQGSAAGIAGIGAGIGAVMLAKKLRAKKKAAAAKKAKK